MRGRNSTGDKFREGNHDQLILASVLTTQQTKSFERVDFSPDVLRPCWHTLLFILVCFTHTFFFFFFKGCFVIPHSGRPCFWCLPTSKTFQG
jgi:hypothetical protein